MSFSPSQIRALVSSQLTLDLRHPKTGEVKSSRAILAPLSYAFSSIVLALALGHRGATMPELLFAGHSFAMVLAAFYVAGSYDDLMGRAREHAQVLVLPISEATIYVARIVGVLLSGGMISLSAALPLGVLGAYQHGLAAGLVVGGSLFVTMTGMMLAALAAVWLITLAAPLRVQRLVLSAVRALLVAVLVIGYQLVATQPTIIVDAPWWPAAWVTDAAGGASAGAVGRLAASVGVLLLLFGLVFPGRYIRLLERTAAAEALRTQDRNRTMAPNRLERLLVRGSELRAGFGLAAAAIFGDRIVRGRVWPAALLALVFGAFGWWTGGLGSLFEYGSTNVLSEPALQMHLSVITILLFVGQAAVQAVQVSDSPEAAWTFSVLPMDGHRTLQIGAQQAILLRVLLPVHAVLAVLLSFSMPLGAALLHVGFWLAGCAVTTRIYALARRQPPLTRRSDQFSAGERFVPLLLSIPTAIVLLFAQALTFATPASALLVVIGLMVIHGGLGQFSRTEQASPPAPAPAGQMALSR